MSIKRTVVASVVGLSLIAGFEGYREYSYEPVKGDRLTIGFGHTEGVKQGDKVDLLQAVHLLEQDVSDAEATISTYVTVPLTQNQVNALVSLVYNIGRSNFRASTLLKCINAKDEACVDTQWLRWKYFKGKVLPGLEKRRAVELAVYRGEPVWWLNEESICAADFGCVPASALHDTDRKDGVATADGGNSAGGGGKS